MRYARFTLGFLFLLAAFLAPCHSLWPPQAEAQAFPESPVSNDTPWNSRVLGYDPGDISNQAIIQAAGLGDPRKVRALLSRGVGVDTRDQCQQTALMAACAAGNVSMVRLLLEHGASVAARDNLGDPPLLFCLQPGVAALLLDRGADVNAHGMLGYTAIMAHGLWSNYRGRLELAKLLVARGANINARNDAGKTALGFLGRGCEPIAHFLLDHGADPNAADWEGVTPLMWTVADPGTQEALIRAGARVNAVDRDGATVLMWAVSYYKPGSVRLLIRCGANVNAADRWGHTALSYALSDTGNGEVVGILKQHGARRGAAWPARK